MNDRFGPGFRFPSAALAGPGRAEGLSRAMDRHVTDVVRQRAGLIERFLRTNGADPSASELVEYPREWAGRGGAFAETLTLIPKGVEPPRSAEAAAAAGYPVLRIEIGPSRGG